MKTIWVAGSKGQLGREIEILSKSIKEYRFLFTDIEELDLTQRDAVLDYVNKEQPSYIINCSAYTAVDKAESEREAAFLINCTVPEILTEAAVTVDGTLIHVSTDYVFDGSSATPYTEEDATNPQTAYGESKLCGDEKVLRNNRNLVIRTSWLYSIHGNNFVKTMLRLGKERDELGVVADQYGSPTSATDLAEAILAMIRKMESSDDNLGGIYHYSNEGSCNWAEFAAEIMKQAGLTCKVIGITTAEYPTPAQRPAYSLMSKEKVKSVFGIEVPEWKGSLWEVLKGLL